MANKIRVNIMLDPDFWHMIQKDAKDYNISASSFMTVLVMGAYKSGFYNLKKVDFEKKHKK